MKEKLSKDPTFDMTSRRPELERLLKVGKVGEGLDGKLRSLSCSPEEDLIVAAENRDRWAKYEALAEERNGSARQIGREFAPTFMEMLEPGMLRQVMVRTTPVWWDGQLPDPRIE